MRLLRNKKWLGTVLIGIGLASVLALLADLAYVLQAQELAWRDQSLTVSKFGLVFLLFFLTVFLILWKTGRKSRALIGTAVGAVWLAVLAGLLCWWSVGTQTAYCGTDSGKAELYADRRVMLFVPHQDDDINVLGGVLEEYVKYGSEVYVVFSTNGDYFGLGEVRLREAVNVLGHIGVPEDHVIFLGYGDHWDPSGPHIYNAESGVQMYSALGRTQTYGLADHPAYWDGADYTADQFLSDIESVILEYRPEVLYCIDYDLHIDHRALMLSFEKVMGNILQEQEDYRPLVLKGYAYYTAWLAEADYHQENLAATQNVFVEPYHQEPAIYRWEDRIRLPVHAEHLSRSAMLSGAHKTLAMYSSQYAGIKASRIFNSDKVFWLRSTESLCYDADIRTSSAEAAVLNDFMLLDSVSLVNESRLPYDGAWIPDREDAEKEILVSFPEARDVETVVLYDHPDPEKNVQNAVISFDDGTSVQTGPLDSGGAATEIAVSKTGVRSFAIVLESADEGAGITEVEAYGQKQTSELSFVKIMDAEENFAYDYWMDIGGSQLFGVYTCGEAPAVSEDAYRLHCDGGYATWQDGRILVECPVGENCTVTVSTADGKLSDSVYIRNPSALERSWNMFWMRAEARILQTAEEKMLNERLVVCRLLTKLPGKLASVFN